MILYFLLGVLTPISLVFFEWDVIEEEQIQEVIKAQQATLKNKGKGQASTLQ